MATQGVGTFAINSFWESGRLIFYEKASGHTTTGNVFILGADYVQVGDTANDVNFAWKGDTTGTFTLDAGAHTLALTGVATSTDGNIAITGTGKATITSTGDYTSPPFVVTRTFVTADFDQTYHAAARVNLDLTNDVPAAKYASALNVRIIGASDVASTGQLYGLWVDSAGTAAAIGGTFYMARYSVQAGAAIPTAYMQFQTADPGVTYAFAFVNNAAIPPCTSGGSDCTASGATDPTYTIAVQTPDGAAGYIRVWAAK